VQAVQPSAGFDEFAGFDVKDRAARDELREDATFTDAQMEDGLALNAAILLKDPSRIAETQALIAKTIQEKGLRLQVIDWQKASGLVGQFVLVLRLVLFVAIFVIFLVALVIINNAMLMSTLERTGEIGTIRAIGGQRGFVVAMFLVETLVLGLIAGGLGATVGAGAIGVLNVVGLPASSPVLRLLFAGPALHPTVSVGNLVFGFVTIVIVSVLSTLYPAATAARVPPVVAMQGKE
jgi:ABC-type lipoprotein release transport system permease subunit